MILSLKMKRDAWFRRASEYWEGIPADVEGMLGGLGELSDHDLKTSSIFLAGLPQFADGKKMGLALDVGAGIGRISSGLLSRYVERVAVLEPNENFIEVATTNLGSFCVKSLKCAIQDFVPSMIDGYKFDIIWIQWVLIYVPDGTQNFF